MKVGNNRTGNGEDGKGKRGREQAWVERQQWDGHDTVRPRMSLKWRKEINGRVI